MTSKGQVTIPRVIRRVMAIKPGDQVVFRIRKEEEESQVMLASQRALTLEETFGSVKPQSQPEDFEALRKIVREEKVERELERMNQEA